MAHNNNDRPVHEIRLGRIKAAIWKNDTESGIRFGVTLSRIYKTDDGWESSSSFGRDDLPLVSKVADMAHTWIYQQNGTTQASDDEAKPSSRDQRKSDSRKQSARP